MVKYISVRRADDVTASCGLRIRGFRSRATALLVFRRRGERRTVYLPNKILTYYLQSWCYLRYFIVVFIMYNLSEDTFNFMLASLSVCLGFRDKNSLLVICKIANRFSGFGVKA